MRQPSSRSSAGADVAHLPGVHGGLAAARIPLRPAGTRLVSRWGAHSSSSGGRRSGRARPVGAAIVAWLAQPRGRGRPSGLRVGLGSMACTLIACSPLRAPPTPERCRMSNPCNYPRRRWHNAQGAQDRQGRRGGLPHTHVNLSSVQTPQVSKRISMPRTRRAVKPSRKRANKQRSVTALGSSRFWACRCLETRPAIFASLVSPLHGFRDG